MTIDNLPGLPGRRLRGAAAVLAAATLLFMAVPASAAPAGKTVFEQNCSVCHAAGGGHPGTMRLAQTRGPEFSVLTERKDLTADYVKQTVRHGLLEMPGFRPSEIADSELDALAAYLAGKGR